MLGHDPADYIGKKVKVRHYGRKIKYRVTEEMVEAVQVAIDYINGLSQEFYWLTGDFWMRTEVRVSLKPFKMAKSGQVDIAIQGGTDLEIIDYKHGVGVTVSANQNTQLMIYALGILYEHDKRQAAGSMLPDLRTVTLTIIQPRAFAGRVPVRQHRMTVKELYKWRDKILLPGIKRAKRKKARLKARPSACQFCPAAHKCPELKRKASRLAVSDFADDVDLEDRVWAMLNAKLIRKWLSSVETYVYEQMMAGDRNYGDYLKLVKKITHRKFRDDKVRPGSKAHRMIGKDLFARKVALTMSEVQKRVAGALGAGASSREVKRFMEKITYKPAAGLTVVPADNPRRPELPPSDFSEFVE